MGSIFNDLHSGRHTKSRNRKVEDKGDKSRHCTIKKSVTKCNKTQIEKNKNLWSEAGE